MKKEPTAKERRTALLRKWGEVDKKIVSAIEWVHDDIKYFEGLELPHELTNATRRLATAQATLKRIEGKLFGLDPMNVTIRKLRTENDKLRLAGAKLRHGAWVRESSWWETEEGQAAFAEWDALILPKESTNDAQAGDPEFDEKPL